MSRGCARCENEVFRQNSLLFLWSAAYRGAGRGPVVNGGHESKPRRT